MWRCWVQQPTECTKCKATAGEYKTWNPPWTRSMNHLSLTGSMDPLYFLHPNINKDYWYTWLLAHIRMWVKRHAFFCIKHTFVANVDVGGPDSNWATGEILGLRKVVVTTHTTIHRGKWPSLCHYLDLFPWLHNDVVDWNYNIYKAKITNRIARNRFVHASTNNTTRR